ncbi:tRNA (adenosine(37)-N6)-dimethylallyltransferase MiaA [Fructobacillus sp. M2-14]|uniref:tRNA dimethylallyltransferase n=1 Tax=Fructobacillus broussonetiae TaxID=2713173 RepID=A0ABS5QZZ0_9LACO|nr:tRNA (adenosine(37)-N6)-dimethylallyltransferase MiaA [Fructobacillus broussonetiae]MBS9338312.1 tRNA (adenosine(37)-N6)-dimethylallyltransferase MiaA [Fructobacillus broussonetiae]
MSKIPIIVIAGPTASGKSDLAMSLAEQFNGELVSADSLQVYKNLDIGTAKATPAEQKRVPQHLLDLVDETANFSVADFLTEADKAILAIHQRGKLPIVVGGTGFYVKALLGQQALEFGESNEEEVKKDSALPLDALVEKLKKLADSDFVSTVDLNNKTRVVRAIQKAKMQPQEKTVARPEYDALVLALDWPREVLYGRINRRVQLMMDAGLEEEARSLYELGGSSLQAGRGIGYKEFYPYFGGDLTLEEVVSAIQQDSRRYAKRQLTYWRHQIAGLQWIDGQDAWALAKEKTSAFLNERV